MPARGLPSLIRRHQRSVAEGVRGKFNNLLKADRLLLFFHGTADEIVQAKSVIDATHPEGWNGNVGCSVYYGCLD